MAQLFDPIPAGDKFVDKEGYLSDVAVQWLQGLTDVVETSPSSISPQGVTAQVASIGVTPIPVGSVNEGLYRLTFAAEVTTAASVSSSLTVTFGWTSLGIAKGVTSGAMTGNTTATTSSATYMFYSDAGAPITYATAYSSVGTPMAYALRVILERVDA